jgi:transposase
MSNRRLETMDVQELLRRLRAGEPERAIARSLKVARKTVRKYHRWAEAEQLLSGDLPSPAELHARLAKSFRPARPPQNQSTLEPYRDEIDAMLTRGLKPRSIYQLLSDRPGFTASESAVWRLCVKLRAARTPLPVVMGRVETRPGEVAQVDFGAVGTLIDPVSQQPRKAQVFVMVLGWSRHMYAEFVFDQSITTWLQCHQRAFTFFGGVPERVVLDNLKSAIIKAYAHDQDVEVQRAYRECAEHYSFLIDPCLPSTPRHKGKVERGGVGYLKQSFLPLLPVDSTLTEANRRLRAWLLSTAGRREHGTTHEQPLKRFYDAEQVLLGPLPSTAYDPAEWQQVKVHRDGHVVFAKAFYSAPTRLVGQHLWLRAGLQEIRLFADNYELVATHPRATQPGQRSTHPDHLPVEKVRGLTASRESCQAEALAIGPATRQVVAELLASRPVDRLRTVVRVLRLAESYSAARLEAACARAVAFGDPSLSTLKQILIAELDALSMPLLLPPAPESSFTFVRPAAELAAAFGGGESWN